MRKRARPLLWTGTVVLAAAPLLACATAKAPEARVDGPALTDVVKSTLAGDGRIARVTNVEVDSTTGVVTLTGRVANAEERESAGRLACSVKGVTVVYNVIEIRRAPR